MRHKPVDGTGAGISRGKATEINGWREGEDDERRNERVWGAAAAGPDVMTEAY
jgi:hypothetical protein